MSVSTAPLEPRASTPILRRGLEAALAERFGGLQAMTTLERRSSPYSSSRPIEVLHVGLSDGTLLPLVFKDVSPRSMSVAARKAPSFVRDPLREIHVYRQLLSDAGLGTAAYYGAVVNRRAGLYWLFLEHVEGVGLPEVGDFGVWLDVARWLARMHDRFRGMATAAPGLPLLRYDERLCRIWVRRARQFARASGPGERSSRLDRLTAGYDRVLKRLMALPVTLVHGEFYASNVLVSDETGGGRVCAVDWEMAGIGPGLLDLAALTAGSWSEEEKQAMAIAYMDALHPGQGWPPGREEFLTALRYCQLHLAVQWLGWSPTWSPPPQHKQDWLGEALRLSADLI